MAQDVAQTASEALKALALHLTSGDANRAALLMRSVGTEWAIDIGQDELDLMESDYALFTRKLEEKYARIA